MPRVTRRIGLSLGADICWPICFEDIVKELDLAIPVGGDTVGFEVRRLDIEPFDLGQSVPYDLVIDRLTHWYHPSREWIKKAVIMNGLYVFNNPWSVQAMEKHTAYCAMMKLGLPIPDTLVSKLSGLLDRKVQNQNAVHAGRGCPRHEPVHPHGQHRIGIAEHDDRSRDGCTNALDQVETRPECGSHGQRPLRGALDGRTVGQRVGEWICANALARC